MPAKIIPTIPFTKEAYTQNHTAYDRLKKLRVEVMERLKAAREMGDLSENGAYKYAKFELGDIGRRMRYLKHLLTNGYVAETKHDSATANFGRTVVLKNGDREFMFLLVSEHESDLTQNKLSINSPIGKAIVGKKAGDEVTVETPKGTDNYQILSIQ